MAFIFYLYYLPMENNSAGGFLFYIDDSRKNQSACYLVFPDLLTPPLRNRNTNSTLFLVILYRLIFDLN